jgi:hypothetical protein
MEAVRTFLAGLSFTAWILVLLAGRTIGLVCFPIPRYQVDILLAKLPEPDT